MCKLFYIFQYFQNWTPCTLKITKITLNVYTPGVIPDYYFLNEDFISWSGTFLNICSCITFVPMLVLFDRCAVPGAPIKFLFLSFHLNNILLSSFKLLVRIGKSLI